MTSPRIQEENACHHARNLCVFSRIQKGTPRLTHNGCVLQRVSLGALSDVTVVLRMRQSIVIYRRSVFYQIVFEINHFLSPGSVVPPIDVISGLGMLVTAANEVMPSTSIPVAPSPSPSLVPPMVRPTPQVCY